MGLVALIVKRKLASHMAFGSDELSLYAVLDELTNYAAYHFKTEEAIWQKLFAALPLRLMMHLQNTMRCFNLHLQFAHTQLR